MKLETRKKGEVLIIEASGGLKGPDRADPLRDMVLQALKQGTRNVLIDMSEVPDIDSVGLGALITSHVATSDAGGSLRLSGISKRVSAILDVTRLSTVFHTYENAEEAYASFGPLDGD